MLPICFSEEGFKKEHIGWYRDGYNVSYQKNNIKRVINKYLKKRMEQ
jgi:predicted 3-demethylubiquinone-9 3-methyltransferase (glyoxalase superfamily)